MPLLFSYGTLQQPDVQLTTFGRGLAGSPDTLPGFAASTAPIDDPRVASTLGRSHHDNARFTGDAQHRIQGTAFEVTDAELGLADEYERPAAYVRTEVTLGSGRRAWVYVHEPSAPTTPRP